MSECVCVCVCEPVFPALFPGVFHQVESLHLSLHSLFDEGLWNTSQSGKHGQQFSASHPLYQSIKLRTVANPLLNLKIL